MNEDSPDACNPMGPEAGKSLVKTLTIVIDLRIGGV
jgi:hypothetical protein